MAAASMEALNKRLMNGLPRSRKQPATATDGQRPLVQKAVQKQTLAASNALPGLTTGHQDWDQGTLAGWK